MIYRYISYHNILIVRCTCKIYVYAYIFETAAFGNNSRYSVPVTNDIFYRRFIEKDLFKKLTDHLLNSVYQFYFYNDKLILKNL